MTFTSTPASEEVVAQCDGHGWGTHSAPRAGVIEVTDVAPHDLVDPKARKRRTGRRGEHWGVHHWWPRGGIEQLVEQRRGLAPQGARPPLVTLAMETNEALSEIEVTGTKVGDLCARAPVLSRKKGQKSAITRASRPGSKSPEQRLDLVTLEVVRLGGHRRAWRGWPRPAQRRRASPAPGWRRNRTACAARPSAGSTCERGCVDPPPDGAEAEGPLKAQVLEAEFGDLHLLVGSDET